ncbi:MAG: biopolymer transporter ExbD [Candidatus Methylacidiphilales bacterium]|nr:biopolymer transporter ExbD [Candidatus Methylacidiphilales bacterium]
MATPRKIEHPQVELQIAPMIDVCFLLLFFYIITSKPVKPEADLSMTLPGTVAQEQALDIPDEQRVEIRANGQIILNDLPIDRPESRELPQLVATLKRFKEACDANKSEALITLDAEDTVLHQRIADVMNACAFAGIQGVSFATGGEDEETF